ncbi:MAG TPA: CHAT domain-containing protein [Pyrinomonadaceae bacterium]|nr:CHAT domain-containing protein [Pyrinomonadaceae bacterium]
MGSSVKSEDTLREYLLGRISDETTLEGIEELLFADEEFCSQVELMEDGIINDYVMGRLNEADAKSFRATLPADPERRARVELTQAVRAKALARNSKKERSSFFASLRAFFRQPMYAGAFAVLLIAVAGLTAYLVWKNTPGELAELRSIYQQARPTETRISEFGYAPLVQLRGAPEPGEQKTLRRIEINLIDATERTPNEETHHALGVFYLTQQKYGEAIREFESALKFANTNAKIHNDLGVAHFELAKTGGKKLEELARSLEEFTKATELNPNLLEALFNKSLALQELNMPREAKESWTIYLQKDSSSPWADEARKNLARIEAAKARFNKTGDEVLSDFLNAFRNRQSARVQQIHNDTKGLLRGSMVPLQLSRTFLDAKQRGDEAQAQESLEAMIYLGELDQEQNGDSFVLDLAGFYEHVHPDKVERLLQAKNAFTRGLKAIDEKNLRTAISEFESSRNQFAQLGDAGEATIAETWAAQLLPDVGQVAESRSRLSDVIAKAETRKFSILLPRAYYSLGMGDYRQNRLSESAKNLKTALRLAETTNNTFEVQHTVDALALNYAEIGEFEAALFYAGKMLSDKEVYFESLGQSRRDKGTLAFLSLKLKFFSTSLSLSREHLRITQETDTSPNTSSVNDSLRRMIDAAMGKDDFPAAQRYAEQSMQLVLARDPSPENTRTTARIYLLLADLKSRTSNWNEALTNYDKALELYAQFPEVTDSLYQAHKGRLFCFQQLDRNEDFSSELKIVLKLAEDYRTTVREDSSRQAFFDNEQIVFDAAAANAIKQNDPRTAFEFSEAARARSLLEFVNSDKPIAEVEKDYASIAKPLPLTQIQQRLPPQVQLVQYTLLPDKLAIWIVSKRRFDSLEKPITANELEEKIDAYQASIMNKAKPAAIKQAAQELYQLLIPSDLTRDQQLCLVPDKSLHQLAFATLVSPAGRYLLEDYALFYAPSATVLILASENAQRKEQVRDERLLSVGNPRFDREENPNLPDLEDAESEARTTAANYRKSQTLFGDEATKEKFLRSFTGVEVIHFAGHFVANRESPGNSRLLFAGGDLRLSELAAYKLPLAKLVVLSACETFLERYNKSEGAIGAARTLLALGAPVVIASQWRVDSAPTKDLMIAFHSNRKQKGMTSAESLRQAQLQLMSRDETSAPFYWAAFSLFGGYATY